jgi:exopolysaccharide/PEP-CTERM locus tyrosine autokinase
MSEMNKPSNFRPSLLERAAQRYDLRADAVQPTRPAAQPESEPREPAADAPKPDPAPAALQTPGKSRSVRLDHDLLRERGLIDSDAPISALAEEFRILKRQLLLGVRDRRASEGAKAQSILVCSAQPEDGKTFCAVNLALSMAAEEDIEVLLIDADFANPAIAPLLGIKPGPGLIDAIADPECDVNKLVIKTDIGSLSYLSAGRRANNATELVASDRTADVFEALTSHNPQRVIILDSPPALVASPASVLASHAGQVMLVVRADKTIESDLREAVHLLSACDSISLVLNRTSLAVGGRKFGSYYGQVE